ncbi:hypothetical protein [Pelomonas sp. KK5]|uniref:hypothetical protein n=1 Tax=Pelomonas sp. KK5 TaxID=1855730 RepID=UPI00097C1335|nr:hypothetical protein [Pelomonas sp. KK5]
MNPVDIELTAQEREALYFIPPAPGGRVVSEAIQMSLQQKGLVTPPREDGRRWLTLIGDQIRRGRRQAGRPP